MTRILLLAFLLNAYALPAHADTKYCSGILTTNNVCIGSESNAPPPTVDCTYGDGDYRCQRRSRR
jgi:hypothetical protein